MSNLRKQFINNFYAKHIRPNQSPLFNNIKKVLRKGDDKRLEIKHFLAQKYPNIIDADVEIVSLALTSQCNLRCDGCSYGREFMPKEQLSLEVVKDILDGMKKMNIPYVVFYGGEPLTIDSSDLLEMVKYAKKLGIRSVLGTNGVRLTPQTIDALYEAGIGRIRISMYGLNEEYNNYVKREDIFSKIESNIEYMRENYPNLPLTLDWLLMKPTCNLTSLKEIETFSKKYAISFSINLVHYDFPYFSNGKDEELQLYEKDLPQILVIQKELINLKKISPHLISNSLIGLNSIHDWLIKKDQIDIPCYRYDNIWIGANGETRVCQKSAILGNVNENSFIDILYTKLHRQSTRDCFALKCSGCHVGFDKRTASTPKSRKRYQYLA